MSTAARIDELRSKFEDSPRRYFAPLANELRKAGDLSGAIALFAVTGRDEPDDDLLASHFIYQRRTLWAAAVVAVAGVILLAAPFALGVPILFALAIWILVRGASGVWALKSGREITDPLGWWI
jgi:uncharacterized membrane protein